MLNKEQFNTISSFEEAWEEINIRKNLISQMVGTLYPSILRDEISELYYIQLSFYGKDQLKV